MKVIPSTATRVMIALVNPNMWMAAVSIGLATLTRLVGSAMNGNNSPQ